MGRRWEGGEKAIASIAAFHTATLPQGCAKNVVVQSDKSRGLTISQSLFETYRINDVGEQTDTKATCTSFSEPWVLLQGLRFGRAADRLVRELSNLAEVGGTLRTTSV
jgi:hypothetical protein